VTITGTDFQPGVVVAFSPGGITIVGAPMVNAAGTQITFSIIVDTSTVVVPTGTQFDISVINPDGGTDTLTNAFTMTS
jgi:hypothetical protein